MMKRIVSLLLVLAMLVGYLPMTARAEETENTEPTVVTEESAETEATAVTEETVPAAETFAPTEAETEPAEETTAPTEAVAEPPVENMPGQTVGEAVSNGIVDDTVIGMGTCGDSLTWILEKDGVLRILGEGEAYELGYGDMYDYSISQKAPWYEYRSQITSIFLGHKVTSIGNYAFYDCYNLRDVAIGDSVTSIGRFAFCYCSSLSNVTIGDSVTSIGDSAFDFCRSLENVIIGDSVTTIGARAFSSCSALNNIVLSESLDSIGNHAFSFCESLSQITLPDGLKSLGNSVFHGCQNITEINIPECVSSLSSLTFFGCENLKKITVSPKNEYYCSKSGVLFSKDMKTLVRVPCGMSGEYSIPKGVETIGSHAMYRSKNLTSVIIPNSILVINNQAFAYCDKLTELSIPKSVTTICSSAFYYCTGLTSMTIPESVTKMEWNIFEGCDNLKSIYFTGNPPRFSGEVFYNITATVYYPEDKYSYNWEYFVGNNYGGNLTWVAYSLRVDDTPDDGEEPEAPVEYHNTLAELTEVDYMAFSHIAYQDFSKYTKKNDEEKTEKSVTVKEALKEMGEWNSWFNKDQGIRNSDLCKHIGQWKVCMDKKKGNGFYAVAFENDQKEAVIAYRGSTKPWEIFTADGAQDWLIHDIPAQVFNIAFSENGDNQFKQGLSFYEDIRKKGFDTSSIVTTGHSLGGGLANIVSARYGCKSVSMNAICILDTIYSAYYEEMAEHFNGVDTWKFMDHANRGDVFAGMYEYYWVYYSMIKPVTPHETNTELELMTMNWFVDLMNRGVLMAESLLDFFTNHSMYTYAVMGGNGDVELTAQGTPFKPTNPITALISPVLMLDLGTSRKDTFNKGLSITAGRKSFGGAGKDEINTSINTDWVIGGKDDDILNGGWGDDEYVYYKGDGYDTIYDVAGNDIIKLHGFSSEDIIDVVEGEDPDFVIVRCNYKPIIRIYKKNRYFKDDNSDTFQIWTKTTDRYTNISEMFRKVAYDKSLKVQCPVDVEILDADGKVVYTLEDGAVGSYYTEYGNFYVFEEEGGGYGKSLDLVEGYTARIVGQDSGTMKIDQWDVTANGLSETPKSFVDVPITEDFTATFEETENGELLLAADTDGDGTVDAKIGYDGKVIPVESVVVSQEYIVLKPEESTQLSVEVKPAELADLIRWSVEAGGEEIISVDSCGGVTALQPGTAYVLATVTNGAYSQTARCRVDVAETAMEEPEHTEKIKLDGVSASTTKLTTELFSTDYAEFDLLLQLPQNYPTAAMSVGGNAAPEHKGVAIEKIKFTASTTAVAFDLMAKDDRTVMIVPTEYALSYPNELAKSYSSTVTVTVDGKEYTTQEELTLTVKKTLPKLKATVPAFNSFYAGQSQEITVTGATVTNITCKNIPDWLTLEGTSLKLTGNVPAMASAKLDLQIATEEWATPATVSLSVKNTFKAPTLKLSASSVTLNPRLGDTAKITVTANPADFEIEELNLRLEDSKKNKVNSDILNITQNKGEIIITTTGTTPAGATYKLYVGLTGGKEVAVTIKTVDKTPTMTLKAKGDMDLSIQNQNTVITPTFKNYSGDFTVDSLTAIDSKKANATEYFQRQKSGKEIHVSCDANTPEGSYTLTLKLKLDENTILENTVKVKVKRTAVKLKLSASKLTLNKSIDDSGIVTVTSTTKGYTPGTPVCKVMDKSGKNSAEGKLDVSYVNGILTVSTTEKTEYGATYKVLVSAYEGAPAQTLTVTIPAEAKSTISSTLKVSGGIDVIRDGSAVTVTPTYKNALRAPDEETLVFYKVNGKNLEKVEMFVYTDNKQGGYTVTKNPDVALDHSAKYKVEVVAKFGNQTVTSKQANLTVKMGSAKMTLTSQDTILFANDKNCRADFAVTTADKALNDISEIEIKDAKYVDLFQIFDYGNGEFAIGYKGGKVPTDLIGKTITINLNIFLTGNQTAKANAAVKLKLQILR